MTPAQPWVPAGTGEQPPGIYAGGLFHHRFTDRENPMRGFSLAMPVLPPILLPHTSQSPHWANWGWHQLRHYCKILQNVLFFLPPLTALAHNQRCLPVHSPAGPRCPSPGSESPRGQKASLGRAKSRAGGSFPAQRPRAEAEDGAEHRARSWTWPPLQCPPSENAISRHPKQGGLGAKPGGCFSAEGREKQGWAPGAGGGCCPHIPLPGAILGLGTPGCQNE